MVIRPAASLREVDGAYELAARIFGPSYPEALARLARIRQREALEEASDVLIATTDKKIVGMTHVLPRKVYLHGIPVPAFGFGHVCIHPDLQGQGCGELLVLGALELAQKKGGVLAIVIARRAVDGFYWKYGFVGIDAFAEVSVIGFGPVASSGGRIRCVVGVSPSRLRDYARTYAGTYSSLPYAFCRDSNWWDYFESRLLPPSSDTRCVNVYLDNHWIGYFILSKGIVVEAAVEPQRTTLFAEALVRYVQRTQEGPVRLALALAHPCIRHVRRFAHAISLRFAWNGGHMVRVLDKGRFLQHWTCSERNGHNAKVPPRVLARTARFDIASHKGARGLMMASFGVLSAPEEAPYGEGAVNHLVLHPVWSMLDEF